MSEELFREKCSRRRKLKFVPEKLFEIWRRGEIWRDKDFDVEESLLVGKSFVREKVGDDESFETMKEFIKGSKIIRTKR